MILKMVGGGGRKKVFTRTEIEVGETGTDTPLHPAEYVISALPKNKNNYSFLTPAFGDALFAK